jgi:hypothetical protein
MLTIHKEDIARATLPANSGNEGWLGVSPKADRYHIVVPVDVQIARGVRACNIPQDGTPFGGYDKWLYFRCPPYADREDINDRIDLTVKEIIKGLAAYDIQAGVVDVKPKRAEPPAKDMRPEIHCEACKTTWPDLRTFLGDKTTCFGGYRPDTTDFFKGVYIFSHFCGNEIQLPVVRFVRSSRSGKSLIGSHACPGYCYYETSLNSCSAVCEGSIFRRLASKLRTRYSPTHKAGQPDINPLFTRPDNI